MRHREVSVTLFLIGIAFATIAPALSLDICLAGMFYSSLDGNGVVYRGNVGEGVTAFRLAAQYVNERAILPPGYRLVTTDFDTTSMNRSVTQTISITREGGSLCPGGPVGIVGPPFSSYAQIAARIAETADVPLVSPSASAYFLSRGFGNFLRTHPADDGTGSALADLTRRLGWDRACVVGSLDGYGNNLVDNFRGQASRNGLTVSATVFTTSFSAERFDVEARRKELDKMVVEMRPLRDEECRIIVATLINSLDILLEALDRLGMIGDDYAILVNDALIQEIDELGETTLLGDPDTPVLSLAEGVLGVVPDSGAGSPRRAELDAYWAKRTNSSTDDFSNPLFDNGDGVPSTAATVYAFDAVLVFANALASMIRAGASSVADLSGAALLAALRAVEVDGFSGRILFEDGTANRLAIPYDLFNVVGGSRVPVGSITPADEASVNGSVSFTREIKWYGEDKPDGYAVFPVEIGAGVFAAGAAVAGTGIFLAIVFAALLVPKRKVPVVRMSSPLFVGLITFGCIVLFVAVILFGLPASVASCNAFRWLAFLGFTLVFGSLFVKIQRTHVIFNHPEASIQGKGITSAALLTKLGLMLAVDVVLLVTWNAAWPIRVATVEVIIARGRDQTLECSSDADLAFFAIFACYKMTLLAWGVWLAVRTRKVSLKDMNESKLIGMALYSIALLAVVAIPVVILLTPSKESRLRNLSAIYVLAFVVLCIAIYIVLLLLVGSKVWLIYVRGVTTQGEKQRGALKDVVVRRGISKSPSSAASSSSTVTPPAPATPPVSGSSPGDGEEVQLTRL